MPSRAENLVGADFKFPVPGFIADRRAKAEQFAMAESMLITTASAITRPQSIKEPTEYRGAIPYEVETPERIFSIRNGPILPFEISWMYDEVDTEERNLEERHSLIKQPDGKLIHEIVISTVEQRKGHWVDYYDVKIPIHTESGSPSLDLLEDVKAELRQGRLLPQAA